MGLKGCKWSSLKAPGTETPQSHPYWELGEFPFPIISILGYRGKYGRIKYKVRQKVDRGIAKAVKVDSKVASTRPRGGQDSGGRIHNVVSPPAL